MSLRVTIFGTLGVFSTTIGVALLVAPATLRQSRLVDQFVTSAGTVPQTTLMFATGLLAVSYIFLAARSQPIRSADESLADAQRRFKAAVEEPPEAVTANRQTATAASVDETLEEAINGSDYALMQVRSALRTIAARIYGEATETPPEDAKQAVEAGTWTTDAVAGAFLARPGGPRPPIYSRLRLWLTPERERRRRIERTLRVIEQQADRS